MLNRSSRQASPRLAAPLVTRPDATAERQRRQRPFVRAKRKGVGGFLTDSYAQLCCGQWKTVVGLTERSSQAGAQRHRRNAFLCRVDLMSLACAWLHRPPSPAALPGIPGVAKNLCEGLIEPMTDFSPHRPHAGAIERFGIPAVQYE